ncbi:MAG: low specificity L-threonine aldolase [Acidimicrobiales bacterium]|nr:MAG: low specificity L-threonine aldolase [Acidimicrobiales bacterium]
MLWSITISVTLRAMPTFFSRTATHHTGAMIFGSDNHAGASDKVLSAITAAYQGAAPAYGDDDYTRGGVESIAQAFGTEVSAFFVSSGTAANMLALSAMVDPWDGVVCHHQAHILLDESTGPSLFTGGAAMLPVPDRTVRMTPDQLDSMITRLPSDAPHNIRATTLSITQANECGQVYSVDEVRALSDMAKSHGLSVHMDGARFANAVAALGVHPSELTWKAGVDVFCLGASKNGAVAAEAIIFFDQSLAKDFSYRLKRTGHLTSKARLYGAQFSAWLADDHWLELARHANAQADALRTAVDDLEGVRSAWPCQSNESFMVFNKELFAALLEAGVSMYDWYPNALPEGTALADNEVLARMVTSFATTDEHIERFVETARGIGSRL